MDQAWFEMKSIRGRRLDGAVWVPLRAAHKIAHSGKYGHAGFVEEFFGAGTVAIPVASSEAASQLGWTDIGLSHQHRPYAEQGKYSPADIYESDFGKLRGVHLVLEQHFNAIDLPQWHLNQDLVLALGLMREKDIWLCPSEDYIDVVRQKLSPDGRPISIEIRAEHLRDYLCARDMSLLSTSYRSRRVVLEDADHINWPKNSLREVSEGDRWEGAVYAIHEGGSLFWLS